LSFYLYLRDSPLNYFYVDSDLNVMLC